MIEDPFEPLAELDRMQALAGYDWFHPELGPAMNAICKRSAELLGTATSMVSIVLDRVQFYLGTHGVDGWAAAAGGTPVEWAFCAHAVLSRERTYIVPDAFADPRHRDSPLVTGEGTRAYAGTALHGPRGHVLGMHCVTSTQERTFTPADLQALQQSGQEVARVLESYRLAPHQVVGVPA